MLFAKTAYSTMHVQTLMIGVLRTNVANGHIPNADTQEQDETAFLRPLFFCTENQKNKEKKANKNNFILHIRCMEMDILLRISKSAVGIRHRNHSAKTMYNSTEN